MVDKLERAAFYAEAKRASAGVIYQLDETRSKTITWWVGRLNGNYITDPETKKYKFPTRPEAVESARRFRQMCRDMLSNP